MTRALTADAPEAVHGERRVLDLGRALEAMADELAPFLEVGRAAEVDGVVLERVPAHEQPVSGRLLERALQLHTLAALRSLKERSGLRDPLLERRFHARLDLDLRDLEDHAPLLPLRLVRQSLPAGPAAHKSGHAAEVCSRSAARRSSRSAALADAAAAEQAAVERAVAVVLLARSLGRERAPRGRTDASGRADRPFARLRQAELRAGSGARDRAPAADVGGRG